jgi:hypothetical protein
MNSPTFEEIKKGFPDKQEFQDFWAKNFPEIPPINHLFKHLLKGRWLRIHSLPDAKRYAETPEEWDILLHRQNTVFADLMPVDTPVCIVSGIYSNEEKVFEASVFEGLPYFKTMEFTELEALDMFKLSKEWYDEGVKFTPCFAEEIYKPHIFDSILKSIANDEWRLFFINPINLSIIAPYDGGVDLIFKDEKTRRFYKKKYAQWLSDREDGM